MIAPEDIPPARAAELKAQGARIVDIREPDERAAGIIPGAAFAPLSALHAFRFDGPTDQPLIFHCRGGGRTHANAAALRVKADGRICYLMRGGIDGWRAAGLPIAQPK